MHRLCKPILVQHDVGIMLAHQDALIKGQTKQSILKVFAPKLGLASRLLMSACMPSPVVATIVFSSITALTATVGQSNYAAANATVNSWAQLQYDQGSNTFSMLWGAWSIGMAARVGGVIDKSNRAGYGVVDPNMGLSALSAVVQGRLKCTDTQVIAVPFDRSHFPSLTHAMPLLDALFQQQTSAAEQRDRQTLQHLDNRSNVHGQAKHVSSSV